ncbi:MAG: hypothetical protein ACLT29_08035 [Ruminococcus callidus]
MQTIREKANDIDRMVDKLFLSPSWIWEITRSIRSRFLLQRRCTVWLPPMRKNTPDRA